jgi:hypothetical protein
MLYHNSVTSTKGKKCPFPNYEYSSDENAELNSTGAPQTCTSVDLPAAKTAAGSREWDRVVFIFHGCNGLQANMNDARCLDLVHGAQQQVL